MQRHCHSVRFVGFIFFVLFVICYLNIANGLIIMEDGTSYLRGAMSIIHYGFNGTWPHTIPSIVTKVPPGYSTILAFFITVFGLKASTTFLIFFNSFLYAFTGSLLFTVLRDLILGSFKSILALLLTLVLVLNSSFLFIFFSIYAETIFLPLFILFIARLKRHEFSYVTLFIVFTLICLRWVSLIFLLAYFIFLFRYNTNSRWLKPFVISCTLFFIALLFPFFFFPFEKAGISGFILPSMMDTLSVTFRDSFFDFFSPFNSYVSLWVNIGLVGLIIALLARPVFLLLKQNHYARKIVSLMLLYGAFIILSNLLFDNGVTFRDRIFINLVLLFLFVLALITKPKSYINGIICLFAICIVGAKGRLTIESTIKNYKEPPFRSLSHYKDSKLLQEVFSNYVRGSVIVNIRDTFFPMYPYLPKRISPWHLSSIEEVKELINKNPDVKYLYFHPSKSYVEESAINGRGEEGIQFLEQAYGVRFTLIKEEPYIALFSIKIVPSDTAYGFSDHESP